MSSERVTVTLPAEVVQDIDRLERNRSKFILEAVQRELAWRRREALRQSLRSPHPESEEMAELGLREWTATLPEEDAADLVDPKAGKPVRWTPGEGWREEGE